MTPATSPSLPLVDQPIALLLRPTRGSGQVTLHLSLYPSAFLLPLRVLNETSGSVKSTPGGQRTSTPALPLLATAVQCSLSRGALNPYPEDMSYAALKIYLK